ncbi:MAG TPA: YggS family pyridoxal phosphate-dependent enzyme, partial [bacterium]
MPPSIAENLAAVRDRMAEAARLAGRKPEDVRLIAVSKTHPAEAVQAAIAAGQRLFGENRVQEAVAKIDAVGAGPEWHLIGHLQTNKAKQVPGHFQAVHSVDSERLAKALATQVPPGGPKLRVFLQLNLHREPSKSGAEDYAGAAALLTAIRTMPGLEPVGLMTIPDPALSESVTRAHFAEV